MPQTAHTPTPRHAPATTARTAAQAATALLALLAGCASPLTATESDFANRLPPERLRTVEPINLDRYNLDPAAAQPQSPSANDPQADLAPFDDRYAQLERIERALPDLRAAALEHNLGLRVALIDPTLATQNLREEAARFEAVLSGGISYSEDDSPTLDITDANSQERVNANLGVDIPLRSGGRASVDVTENWRSSPNPFFTADTTFTTVASFSLAQPLLRNAGRRVNTNPIRIAGLEQQASEARTKLEVIRTLAEIDRAYWQLFAAERALAVAQQQYELALSLLERARRLVTAGAQPRIEVTRAQAALAQRLEGIIIAENQALDAQRRLKRLVNEPGLGVGSQTAIDPTTEPAAAPLNLDAQALAKAAINTRMESLELELQLAADALRIENARNGLLPSFALDYRYQIAGLGTGLGPSIAQVGDNDFESWTAGVSGEIPLGNDAAEARLRRAVLARIQRLGRYADRREQIIEEVYRAVDNTEAAWQRILASAQSVLAAARTFEAEQRAFDARERTATEVSEAAFALADAQLAEIRAVADYQVALVDLAFATGTVLGQAQIDWAPTTGENEPFAADEPAKPSNIGEPDEPLYR